MHNLHQLARLRLLIGIRWLQEEQERLRADLERAEAESQQVQKQLSMQLATAEKRIVTVSAAADEAVRIMKEEHGSLINNMLRKHQIAQDGAHSQMLLVEVRALKPICMPISSAIDYHFPKGPAYSLCPLPATSVDNSLYQQYESLL